MFRVKILTKCLPQFCKLYFLPTAAFRSLLQAYNSLSAWCSKVCNFPITNSLSLPMIQLVINRWLSAYTLAFSLTSIGREHARDQGLFVVGATMDDGNNCVCCKEKNW